MADFWQNDKKVGEAEKRYNPVESALWGGMDMLTFGLLDEGGAALDAAAKTYLPTWMGGGEGEQNFRENYGEALEANRDIGAQVAAQNPIAHGAGMIGGALLTPGALGKTLLGAVGKGALQGGTYAAGSAEGGPGEDGSLTDRILPALEGAAVGGALGGALRGGVDAISASRASKAASSLKAGDEMADAAGDMYEKARASGANATAKDTADITNDLMKIADDEGLIVGGEVVDFMPRVKTALRKFTTEVSGKEMTPEVIQKTRKALQKVADSADDSESRIGVRMLRRFNELVEERVPGMRDADRAYSKAMRMKTVEELSRLAEIDVMNDKTVSKATRDQFASLLKRITRGQEIGWSDAEIRAIEEVVKGNGTAKSLDGLRKVFSPNSLPGAAAAFATSGMGLPVQMLGGDLLSRAAGGLSSEGVNSLKAVIAGQPAPSAGPTLERLLGKIPLAGGVLGPMVTGR